MRELIITENEAGQRFDKYLKKYLDKAPASFIYKMLRKKNITLNEKKADGTEKLSEGDLVKLFLSDETVEKFCSGISYSSILGVRVSEENAAGNTSGNKALSGSIPHKGLVYDISDDIIYQDKNVLFINKKAGILSQKAKSDDISINEYMIDYLLRTGRLTAEQLKTFKPSVCNRLDRNTSGLITCGISLMGLQELSRLFKERGMDKYYLAVVAGEVKSGSKIKGYLKKDERTNKVTITDEYYLSGFTHIETEYEPVALGRVKGHVYSILRIKLITGKTHQIRAHLSSIGHPILGDMKYGNAAENSFFREAYGVKSQLLHSYELKFTDVKGGLSYLNGQTFKADTPKVFGRFERNSGNII